MEVLFSLILLITWKIVENYPLKEKGNWKKGIKKNYELIEVVARELISIVVSVVSLDKKLNFTSPCLSPAKCING